MRRLILKTSAMWALLCSAGVDPPSSTDDQPRSTDERMIFVQSFEGQAPQVTEYRIRGRFEEGEQFDLVLRLRENHWIISSSGGDFANLTIRLPIAPREINLSKLTLGKFPTPSGDQSLHVFIPYGDPQTACFRNGRDIYPQISLIIGPNDLVAANRLSFPDCAPTYSRLRWRDVHGEIEFQM